MIDYETALANKEKALKAHEKTSIQLRKAKNKLEEAIKEIKVECYSCYAEIQVNQIELIVEEYNETVSYLDNYNGDWSCQQIEYWVCPKCKNKNGSFENKGPFILGFKNYVKTIHTWNSDHNRQPSGRILELLTPHLEKEAAKRNKEEKERKIKEAKKLLESEGILK
jgi:hypothetical protein